MQSSLPYDVDFRFSTSEGEVSEFENTMEFHVQRGEHHEKVAHQNQRNEEDSNHLIRGGAESVLKEMRYKSKYLPNNSTLYYTIGIRKTVFIPVCDFF